MTARKLSPEGLPVYRFGEIPDGMATATMLRRQRRRPAERQPAVALLLYRGNKHAPLYQVSDSQSLPALPPGRQAAWTTARTCVRCATTSDTPLWRDRHDRRLCQPCGRLERLAAARPAWLALRQQAVDWARGVLDDPDAVLMAVHRIRHGYPIEVHAVTHDRQVLVDVLVWPQWTSSTLARTPGAIDADRLVPHLTPLVGRRLIHLGGNWNGGPLRMLSEASTLWAGWDQSLADPSIREHLDDHFGQRWTDWHARTWSNGDGLSRGHHGRYGLTTVPIDRDSAAGLAAAMHDGLALMATDQHPDGPPTCPWLPPTGVTACGAPTTATGLCPAHRGDTDTPTPPDTP